MLLFLVGDSETKRERELFDVRRVEEHFKRSLVRESQGVLKETKILGFEKNSAFVVVD